MRFLVDECTGPAVASWLRDHNHEVFSVFDEARGVDGVILLRLEDETSSSKIRVLSHLLQRYQDRLHNSFVVVTEKQVRFAQR